MTASRVESPGGKRELGNAIPGGTPAHWSSRLSPPVSLSWVPESSSPLDAPCLRHAMPRDPTDRDRAAHACSGGKRPDGDWLERQWMLRPSGSRLWSILC